MGTLRNRFLEHLLPSLRSLVEIYYLWLTKLPLYTRLHLKMVIFSLEYCKIDLAMLKFRFSQIAKHDGWQGSLLPIEFDTRCSSF
jgi:hypothetical protein